MADEIAQAALVTLKNVISSYLPQAVPPAVTRNLFVIPKSIRPLGIGGYVGAHLPPASDVPDGDLIGCTVVAQAEITFAASSANIGSINTAIDQSTTALLTNDRATLRGDGIQRLQLQQLSPVTGDASVFRSAIFDIRFECVPPPAQSQGVIETLRFNTLLSSADGSAQFIANMNFADLAAEADPLQQFASITDPAVDNGSANASWVFNAGAGRIEQLNNVRGGVLTLSQPRKAGAQLLIQPAQKPLAIKNGVFTTEFESSSRDGIGLVFRWTDDDNFYFFLASSRHNYQLFGRKVAGVFAFMEQGGVREDQGFNINMRQQIRVVANGDQFEAWFGETRTLTAQDSGITDKGQVGLLAHGNNAAFFYGIDIVKLL
jgi:hypothetical protein